MRHIVRLTLGCLAAPLLLGCAAAPRAAAWTDTFALRVEGSPSEVLERIRADADVQGWRIADVGIDSIDLDLGTADAPMPPADGGAPRLTEVHCAARFVARRDGDGTGLTVRTLAAYWNPDRRVWVAAPTELAPARAFLAAVAGASGPAAPGIADAELR